MQIDEVWDESDGLMARNEAKTAGAEELVLGDGNGHAGKELVGEVALAVLHIERVVRWRCCASWIREQYYGQAQFLLSP